MFLQLLCTKLCFYALIPFPSIYNQSIPIYWSIGFEKIDNHTNLRHWLVIDYQYQSINWYRLVLIDIVIDYRFYRFYHWALALVKGNRQFMGLSSTIIYTSELILCSTICVSQCYAAQHSYVPLLSLRRDWPSKSSPTFSVRPCSSVGRVTVDLIRRSWVRFPPRSKDFFFASCGSLFPFTRANAQWVIHGFK